MGVFCYKFFHFKQFFISLGKIHDIWKREDETKKRAAPGPASLTLAACIQTFSLFWKLCFRNFTFDNFLKIPGENRMIFEKNWDEKRAITSRHQNHLEHHKWPGLFISPFSNFQTLHHYHWWHDKEKNTCSCGGQWRYMNFWGSTMLPVRGKGLSKKNTGETSAAEPRKQAHGSQSRTKLPSLGLVGRSASLDYKK